MADKTITQLTADSIASTDELPFWDVSASDTNKALVSDLLALFSLTLAGDSGSSQALANANTLTIAGGNAIATAAGATDTLTVNFDLTVLTEESSVSGSDYVVIYDASASGHRKMTRANFLTGISGTPGGSNTQVQYNNSGAFGGMAAMIYDNSTGAVTLTSQAAATIPLKIVGAASQSGRLLEFRSSANGLLAGIEANGLLHFSEWCIDRGNNNGMRATSSSRIDLVIGGTTVLAASSTSGGQVGIGIVPSAPIHAVANDAATNTVTNVAILGHNSSGTPTTGFGTGLKWQGESSTTADTEMARIRTEWATATHASRAARMVFEVYDTAAREFLSAEADGTQALIGVFGATPIAKPTVTGSRGGNAALASLLTALADLGWLTDSSS